MQEIVFIRSAFTVEILAYLYLEKGTAQLLLNADQVDINKNLRSAKVVGR